MERRCSIGGLASIVTIFHTVFVLVYHYAISELCKGLYHHNGESGTSPHDTSSDSPVSTTGASAADWSMPCFLTNAAATVTLPALALH